MRNQVISPWVTKPILLASVAVAWAAPIVLSGRVDAVLLAQFVTPALWLGVGFVALLAGRVSGVWAKADGKLVAIAWYLGLAHVAALFLSGVAVGFGHSPYSFAPLGIALNVLYAGSRVLGACLARGHLLAVRNGERFVAPLIGTAVLFTAVESTPASIGRLDGGMAVVGLLAGRFLPGLAENLLVSLLVVLGGAWAGVAYQTLPTAFRWLSPILPNTSEVAGGFIGSLVPVALLLLTARLAEDKMPRDESAAPKERRDAMGWVASALVGTSLVWFSTGALGPRPFVVISPSMEPGLCIGDIVISSPVEPEEVRQGDILVFNSANGPTVHRVLRKERDGAAATFVTKGDNNDAPDSEPVSVRNVQGRVRVVVPWIGWAAIMAKRAVGIIGLR